MMEMRVERLRNQILEEIRAFNWNLKRLESLDFSNPEPERLIQDLEKDVKAEQDILDLLGPFFDGRPGLAIDLLGNSHRKIAARIPFLGYIERAQTQHTPWSLSKAFKIWQKKLFLVIELSSPLSTSTIMS
jgi:hypothetical protein